MVFICTMNIYKLQLRNYNSNMNIIIYINYYKIEFSCNAYIKDNSSPNVLIQLKN
jgi:hypothetical protein